MKLISILLAILLLTGCQSTVLSEDEYLSKNYKPINLNSSEDFSGLEILEKNLINKEIILTGENHGINLDNKLQIKLVKY